MEIKPCTTTNNNIDVAILFLQFFINDHPVITIFYSFFYSFLTVSLPFADDYYLSSVSPH